MPVLTTDQPRGDGPLFGTTHWLCVSGDAVGLNSSAVCVSKNAALEERKETRAERATLEGHIQLGSIIISNRQDGVCI